MTQNMCSSAMRIEQCSLPYVPDHFRTQKMCDKAVKDDPSFLQFASDWFVTQEQMDPWVDNVYHNYDYALIEWYKDCQNCKAQKAQIKTDYAYFLVSIKMLELVYVRR